MTSAADDATRGGHVSHLGETLTLGAAASKVIGLAPLGHGQRVTLGVGLTELLGDGRHLGRCGVFHGPSEVVDDGVQGLSAVPTAKVTHVHHS